MIRIETGESSPSRRTPPRPKQKPAKRPNLLQRIFGSKGIGKSKPAQCAKTADCPPHHKDMLLI
jgi:hypothetical protein